jgi:hypothetical protein
VNDPLLCEWWISITYERTISRIVISIYPCIKYPVACRVSRVKIVIAFHIINDKKIGRRKAPERTCPRAVSVGVVGLINPPVVCGIPLKLSGFIAFFAKVSTAF